jgi:hypothetical protein
MLAVARFDEVMLLYAFFASVVFLVHYWVRADWWETPLGTALFCMDGALALALLPSALHYLTGLNTGHVAFAWYYGASLGVVGSVTVWRIVINELIQRSGRRDDEERELERAGAPPDDAP